MFLPYARAIVPARLWGLLARVAPFSAARELKHHTDFVDHECRRILLSRKQALEQDGEYSKTVSPGIGSTGKDLLGTLCELSHPLRRTFGGPDCEMDKWKPTWLRPLLKESQKRSLLHRCRESNTA